MNELIIARNEEIINQINLITAELSALRRLVETHTEVIKTLLPKQILSINKSFGFLDD